MPTHKEEEEFLRDLTRLSRAQRSRFYTALYKMIDDLSAGREIRPGLRVKGVQGHEGIFEMTWAPDGRATFCYGEPLAPGETYIIWRRIGDHCILAQP